MAFSYKPMTPNSYVSFVKATEALWSKLEVSQRLSNVLYFVVNDENDAVGKLYLGNTLIADGNGITAIGMANLRDVKIDGSISNGDVLMYNMSLGKWENVNLANQLGNLINVFTGATETEAGTSGLVPSPGIGDHLNYLRGDGTWANPVEQVTLDLDDLKSRVDILIDKDENVSIRTIAGQVANTAASAAVAKVIDGAPGAFDTLKEIADWIQSHPTIKDTVALSNKVTTLENLVQGNEESGIVGLVSQVNTLKTDVSTLTANVETISGNYRSLQSTISALQGNLTTLTSTVESNTSKITSLEERLVWQKLVEE